MKKIQWTKKRIILSISSIALALCLIAGGVFAAIYFNSDVPTSKKKIIIKKKIITSSDVSDDNGSLDEENMDYNTDYTDESDSVFINVLKKIKRIFDNTDDNDDYATYNNISKPVKTLYVKDYGAVGNGATDDAKSIFNAVMDLSECGPGSKLVFESNKLYYVKDIQLSAAIVLTNVKGLEIDGKNSTILMGSLKSYMSITNTLDCCVKNFHCDFATKPAFGAECLSINEADGYAIMKADRDIGLKDGESYVSSVTGYFGVLNIPTSRFHMFITKYEMISKSERTFKLYLTLSDANTNAWFRNGLLQDNGMICPMPYIGHTCERGFTISSNDTFEMDSVKIHSCSRFGMLISENQNKLTFNNVDFIPADNNLDKNLNFTSWRDTFHVKDNRCKIFWTDCEAIGNYDDIFNISSSGLYVSDYNIAKNRITLIWPESKTGVYHKILPGDTISFIDTQTGEDCGTATVKRVVSQSKGNIIVTEEPVDGLINTGTSINAYFTNRCAPGSVIDNCDFNGTARFRGPITIKNTNYYNQRTWIDLFEGVEGPIPSGIHFVNCNITTPGADTILIGANSGNTDKNGYHVSDILFDNCTIDSNSLSIYSSDKQYVKVTNCKEHDGTAIPDMN